MAAGLLPMPLDVHDTIAALSSPPGPAVRGIVRLSGSGVRASLEGLFEPDCPDRWQQASSAQRHPGRFLLRDIGRGIRVSVSLWPDARSYTGEPMAEVHAPGSPPLLEAMLAALYRGDVRPARAGEFTLRSFLAGKIDLVQAEAVLGVIDADDPVALQRALEQLAGGISGRITTLRNDLLGLLADLEAGLDFVEEDIAFVEREAVLRRLRGTRTEVALLIDQAGNRMRSSGAARVVLAGLPNAGKSTLFNALLGRSAALVSEVAGTTRDYLSAEVHWQGMRLELVDTAGGRLLQPGWEPSRPKSHRMCGPEKPESRTGTSSARAASVDATDKNEPPTVQQRADTSNVTLPSRDDQLRRADLVLWCTSSEDRANALDNADSLSEAIYPVLRVTTKCDLRAHEAAGCLAVSGLTGMGLDSLIAEVVGRLSGRPASIGQLSGTTGARCRDSLEGAAIAIERAMETAESEFGDELLAVEIRVVLDELGKICGAVYTDDVLDRIFSSFCIGK